MILYIDGLVQDCSNSSALAMELLQSCTKPSILSLPQPAPSVLHYSQQTRSVLRVLMSELLVLSVHQHPFYWWCKMGPTLPYIYMYITCKQFSSPGYSHTADLDLLKICVCKSCDEITSTFCFTDVIFWQQSMYLDIYISLYLRCLSKIKTSSGHALILTITCYFYWYAQLRLL